MVYSVLFSVAGCCARQGALPSACGTAVDHSKFVSLSSSTGYAKARGEVPDAELWMGSEPVYLRPTQPRPLCQAGVCRSQRAALVWPARARESIINAICRNESVPLKCVFEQVLEKTLRW